MAMIEVFTGAERRRRWSAEEKRALVAAAFAPGAVVRDVARRADVVPNLLYRWRRDLRAEAVGFTEVAVGPTACGASVSVPIEVEASGIVIRIGATAPPALAAAIISALVRG
jgi:transposase